MFVDRHLYRGRLNYQLFGRRVEKVKSWLHRITAPSAPATKPESEPDARPTEDVALRRSYHYDTPPAELPDEEMPAAPPPPTAEPERPPEPPAPAAQAAPESPAEPDPPLPPSPEPETTSAPESPAEPAQVTAPTPPPEGDDYNEDEEYLQHMANADEEPQPGAVDADDLLVLLSVFSKGKSATEQEITTARRAMRAISGSQIEQAILDQLNGKDGYVAVMLDMITKDLHEEDEAPMPENKKSVRAFRLEDYV